MEGKPITTFLVVALILWGIYLWRQGRLGQVQMLPHPAQAAAPLIGPPVPSLQIPRNLPIPRLEPAPPSGPGWQSLPGVMQ